MNTTPNLWWLAVHFGYLLLPTGWISKRKHTQSPPISPVWHETYYLSYCMVSEWWPVFLQGETSSAGGRQNPQARPFTEMSSQPSLLELISGHWHMVMQYWITWMLKTTWTWRERWSNKNFTEWARSTTFWRYGSTANTYVVHRSNLTLTTSKYQPYDTFQILKR